jgi:hypothetical protein
MNFFLKQKFWFFIAVFFMVVNITLLTCLWHNKHKGDEGKHHRHEINEGKVQNEFNLTDYLAEQLAFSAEQKQKLAVVNDKMELLKDSLSEQNEISKDLFSKELSAYTTNKKKQDSLITCMSSFTQVFNKTRIEHIDKIKAICNGEQKKKLVEVLSNLNGINFKRRHHHNKHH